MKKSVFQWLLIFSLYQILLAQEKPDRREQEQLSSIFGRPMFIYNTYNLASPDRLKSRLELHLAFVNDILQFAKESENRYRAQYEVSVEIFDRKGNHVEGKTSSNQIVVTTFEATNSRDTFNREQFSFELVPGKYKVLLELTDKDTKKQLRREKEIYLIDFSPEKVHLSDVLFTDELVMDSTGIKRLVPNLLGNFDDPESSFCAYYEVYPPSTSDSVKISYEIIDSNNTPRFSESWSRANTGTILQECIELKRIVTQPGRYFLEIEAKAGKSRARLKQRFFVQWGNLSITESNIEKALEPLLAFYKAEDLKDIDKATESEKQKQFDEFWKRRDPTPDTEKNELKEEFYRRVDFANRHFTVYALDKQGWETDRGRIYLKYGPPSEVERHSTDITKPPYEIWYYATIEQRFIFEDRSGVGDYQLVRME